MEKQVESKEVLFNFFVSLGKKCYEINNNKLIFLKLTVTDISEIIALILYYLWETAMGKFFFPSLMKCLPR